LFSLRILHTTGGDGLISSIILEKLRVITQEEQTILQGSAIDRSIYTDSDRDVVEGHKLLEPGKLLAVRPHTRFVEFPEHTHDYVEMVYMCRGTTTHVVNGREVVLNAGELLLMGQNTRQRIYRAEKTDLAVNFIIRPEFFGQTLPYLGTEETPLRSFLVDSLCGEHGRYLLFRVADVLPVQNLVENLVWTLITDTPGKQGINAMTMGLLFLQLANHTDRLQTGSAEEDAVVQTLRYVEDNYRTGSLTEAAAIIHCDPVWLSRRIKSRTGKNYTDLVQEKRLSQAAWLLTHTDRRVMDIAVSVGYENISYFHRIFQRWFGCTPKQYRDCK